MKTAPIVKYMFVIEILVAIFLFIDGIFLGFAIESLRDSYQVKFHATNQTNCTNMSLPDAATCLRNFVAPQYKYVIRDDDDKTMDDILENGGDCYDYSMLYVKLAEAAGYHATLQKINLYAPSGVGHAVAILTDPDFGYCIMDMKIDPFCVALDLRTINVSTEEVGG